VLIYSNSTTHIKSTCASTPELAGFSSPHILGCRRVHDIDIEPSFCLGLETKVLQEEILY